MAGRRLVALTTAQKKKYSAHIGDDVMYPASCNDIMTACSGMSEFSKAEKDWFAKALPHGTFSTAAEVRKAVGV